jgi:hypothetical protein
MSINLAITVPLEAAVAIRHMRYTFESIETNEPGLESALSTVCSAVIEAIKSLPHSLSAHTPPLQPDSRNVSEDFSEILSLRSSQRSDPFEVFSPVPSFSTNSSTSMKEPIIKEVEQCPIFEDEGIWGSPPSSGFQRDFNVEVKDAQGISHQISVYGDMTVSGLQTKVERLFRLAVDQQKLVWRGYRLNQLDATLSSVSILKYHTLFVVH